MNRFSIERRFKYGSLSPPGNRLRPLYSYRRTMFAGAGNTPKGLNGQHQWKSHGQEQTLSGIVVIARDPSRRWDQGRYRGTTDQAGNYRITNIAPGTYQVKPERG